MAANTKKPPTKSEIYAKIVEDTGLTRKDVAAVFESLDQEEPWRTWRPGIIFDSRSSEDACREEAGS
jgi:hypothetical protein